MRGVMLSVVLAVSACGASTTFEFEPRDPSAALPAAVVDDAVLAFRDDAEILARAGAEILGSLEIDGSATADEADLRARATLEAARRGGTHAMAAVERTSDEWDEVTSDGTIRWGEGDHLGSEAVEGHTISRQRSRGLFIVIRVPADRWTELPAPLRPR